MPICHTEVHDGLLKIRGEANMISVRSKTSYL
jgi:hypothetical protein